MNIQYEKLEVAKMVLNTDNKKILNRIRAIFREEDDMDLWDELPERIKKSVETAIKQANSGKLKSHADVLKKYR